MNKNDAVTITACANGFIIEPRDGYSKMVSNSEVFVFDSHADFIDFLSRHFELLPIETGM